MPNHIIRSYICVNIKNYDYEKVIFLFNHFCPTIVVQAQFYNVGSSTSTETNYSGNTVTVHKDRYGRVTGKSTTSQTDYFGNTTTTHTDAYGRVISESITGKTDYFGNKKT